MKRAVFLLVILICAANCGGDNFVSSPWGESIVWHRIPIPHPDTFQTCSLYKQILDSMVSCGIKWNKPNLNFHWLDIEWDPVRHPGKYNWSEPDSLVRFCQERGIFILPYWLGGCPPYYNKRRNFRCPPDETHNGLQAWYNFVKACVERYDGDGIDDMPGLKMPIKYWEVVNEPGERVMKGYGTFEDWQRVIKIAYRAAHEADPDCKIVGPGVTRMCEDSTGMPIIVRRMEEMLSDSVGSHYLDVISFHCYHGIIALTPAEYFAIYDTLLLKVIDKYAPGKPIWITEVGWRGHKPKKHAKDHIITWDTVAVYYVQFCDELLKRDRIEKVFFFCARSGWWGDWGILDENFVPRPPFYAYREYLCGYYKPYLWSRDSLSTAYGNARKAVIVNGKPEIVYRSNGSVVYANVGDCICDTITKGLTASSGFPALAMRRDGTVCVVFISDQDLVYYTIKPPHSYTFRRPEVLYLPENKGEQIFYPSLCVDEAGNYHLSYVLSKPDGKCEVRYLRFTYNDGSVRILSDETVSGLNSCTYIPRPSIVLIGRKPVVVWRDGTSLFISIRNGEGWRKPLFIAGNVTHGDAAVCSDNREKICVVWQADSALFFVVVDPLRWNAFPVEMLASTNGPANPFLALKGDSVFVAFSKAEECNNPYIDSTRNIYVGVRKLGKWNKWVVSKVVDTPIYSDYPQILISDSKKWLIWTEGRYGTYRVAVDSTFTVR